MSGTRYDGKGKADRKCEKNILEGGGGGQGEAQGLRGGAPGRLATFQPGHTI